ncbi:hypothetical protein [Amycolatopsis kentuckyensis]|uniref:hypothetical protein n=1 Tax=Amycolatopsis kentuckyensis TaxID=218823 RepID=UPI000A3A50DE|nr:hypothetical protein [Amycolatopsis kentuckyensis]
MNLFPHAKDVVQITGHPRHQGCDLHGMVGFVDFVEDQVVTLHLDNANCGIRAAVDDLDVLYRTRW